MTTSTKTTAPQGRHPMKRAENGTMGSVLSITLPLSMVVDIERLAMSCGVNRSFWSSAVLTGNRTQCAFGKGHTTEGGKGNGREEHCNH